MKTKNPYKERTMIWALYEEDYSDLTASQIADVFGTTKEYVNQAMRRIKRETGYVVPYVRLSPQGRPICK